MACFELRIYINIPCELISGEGGGGSQACGRARGAYCCIVHTAGRCGILRKLVKQITHVGKMGGGGRGGGMRAR